MRKGLSPSPGEALSGGRVFGVSLDELQRSGQPGHEVPLLVRSIVEYIEEHGDLDLEGFFQVNGTAERVDWLRQRYDSGAKVDLQKEADLATAVSLLRLFLQELPEPVIPTHLQTHILQIYRDYSSEEEQARNMKYFLQQLPQVNHSLLRFLCRFLSGVASLQEESWSVGALAAVFGPDIFQSCSLDSDVEDLKEQDSVSRILAELLENQEEFFDSEEDDLSTTNDYSSINEQITELLEDEKLEVCEELPVDGEDGASPRSAQHSQVTPSSSSHLTSLSILPGSAETIRAAVEQHFLELQSSIEQDISSYESQGQACPSEQGDVVSEECTCPGEREEYGQSETGSSPAPAAPEAGQAAPPSPEAQGSRPHSPALEEGSRMELDADALVNAENNINASRQESYQACERMDQTDDITTESAAGWCDLNANPDSQLGPAPPSGRPQLQLFSDGEWEEAPWLSAPPIDFSCLHLQREGLEPVPAFPSWQGEGDCGEAQLSPLAGRVLPLPLGEDAQPLLARRFLDFGHSQRFLQQDPDANSTSKALRPRRASFSSRESVKGDSVSHQLTRKLQNLKRKIKQFEEQFEKEKNYKPSHADKAANPKVLKWMTDLTKIRKQLKDAKQKAEGEMAPHARPRSNTLPKSFGSTLDSPTPEGPAEARQPTREETLGLIQRRLGDKRQEDGWPEDIRKMTKEQLSCEKTVLQKNLLHYEGLHGRPVTREERQIVKPLYDRYRLVKQMLTRVSITPIIASPSSKRRNQMLQPIIEGETAHFCDEIKEEEEETEEEQGGEMKSEGSEFILALDPTSSQEPQQDDLRSKMEESSGKLALDLRLSSPNASSMPELLEQLWKARAEKKKLRKTIREFEDDFYQHNGRNVQKEDRLPLLEQYREYKRIKAKLRLLEVLISKQDSSKSI